MTANLSFYIRAITQRLICTVGLILLWRHLWPTILKTLEAFSQEDGTFYGMFTPQQLNTGFWQVFFLVFLTIWFYRYLDGFFGEWYLTEFKLYEAAVALVRWLMLMLWYLIYPIILGLAMYWGLVHYTPVYSWLKHVAAWGFFFVALLKGWHYPYEKLQAIAYRFNFT